MRTPLRVMLVLAASVFAIHQQATPQATPRKTPMSGLSGVVVDTTESPVQYAVVTIGDDNVGTTADEDGKFRLSGLNFGRTLFRVRRVGYDPVTFQVTLPDSATVEVRITMRLTPRVIAPVVVNDVREPLKRVGFYERMAAGSGHFITP